MPFVILCIALTSLAPQVAAQQDPRALDPADVFFQAWLTIRDAEKLEKEKKYGEAWRKYRQAAKYYDVLSRFHKNWKPHLVVDRVASTTASIKQIEPKAAAELAGKQAKTKDLVEGGPQPTPNAPATGTGTGNARMPTPPVRPTAPHIASNPVNSELQRKLRTLERDNQRLREELSKARSAPANTGNKAEQKRLIEEIAKRDRELTSLRNILARAPLQKDMDQLTRKNRTVTTEIEITARALKESQRRLAEAQKTAKKHEEDAELAERRAEEIQKNMDTQKKIDNRVVRELRKELGTVTKLLESTRRELGAANAEVARMQRSLNESQATIKELTRERDDLRTERDTLANILKKSDSNGVQKLIAENMRLGKELKEALDRLEFLKRDNNATKDELVEAQRDLAIAKTRIMRYQQEQSDHARKIKTMEKQLRDAEAELLAAQSKGNGNGSAAPGMSEEVEILKATVKRLMASQERRRTAEKILWDTYQKSKVKIPGLPEVISDIRKAKVELTKQEKVLITYRKPDVEFTSPKRVSITHARAHASALEGEIATYTPLMKRAFEKGRFEAARQILEDMDERFPGHFPTLCNRGVVELKTNQFNKASELFSEAITMRENSSYAHHMLGLSLYEQDNLDGAQSSFQRALVLKPGNAKAHLYLGNIAGKGRRYQQAQEHFLTALKLDSTLTEAYFNLSLLFLQQKKKKEATDYYAKALENGLSPNPTHEKMLSK